MKSGPGYTTTKLKIVYTALFADFSTLKNCLLWDLDYNSIQNTSILGGGNKIVAIYKIRPSNLNIAIELVFPWIFVAITKINY